MRWLTISGSLRKTSTNSAALDAFARLAPPAVEIVAWRDLGVLPAFNPDDDREGAPPPASVSALRAAVADAAALVIAAPEYAHGFPGALKNALDWLVSSDCFPGKPVALINTAPRAFHAQSALREVLATMAARLTPEAFAILPLTGRVVTTEDILADSQLAAVLRAAGEALYQALQV